MTDGGEGEEEPVHAIVEASLYGELHRVSQLLASDPQLLNAQDKDHFNRTPLMMACRGGHLELVRLLVERGAHLGLVNTNGNTALYWACLVEHDCYAEVVKVSVTGRV
jgi:ankyrin repeat protein